MVVPSKKKLKQNIRRRRTYFVFVSEIGEGYNRVYIGNFAWDTKECDIYTTIKRNKWYQSQVAVSRSSPQVLIRISTRSKIVKSENQASKKKDQVKVRNLSGLSVCVVCVEESAGSISSSCG
uniref:Uncharacterized protein n=1 Tax=Brassica campestris TaxID=3711 RepID=M4DE35_BRACM